MPNSQFKLHLTPHLHPCTDCDFHFSLVNSSSHSPKQLSHYSWSQSSLTPGSLSAHDDAFYFTGKIEAFDRKPPQPSTPSISKQVVFLHRLPGEMLQCNCHWLNLRPKLTHHPSFPHSEASLGHFPRLIPEAAVFTVLLDHAHQDASMFSFTCSFKTTTCKISITLRLWPCSSTLVMESFLTCLHPHPHPVLQPLPFP